MSRRFRFVPNETRRPVRSNVMKNNLGRYDEKETQRRAERGRVLHGGRTSELCVSRFPSTGRRTFRFENGTFASLLFKRQANGVFFSVFSVFIKARVTSSCLPRVKKSSFPNTVSSSLRLIVLSVRGTKRYAGLTYGFSYFLCDNTRVNDNRRIHNDFLFNYLLLRLCAYTSSNVTCINSILPGLLSKRTN